MKGKFKNKICTFRRKEISFSAMSNFVFICFFLCLRAWRNLSTRYVQKLFSGL